MNNPKKQIIEILSATEQFKKAMKIFSDTPTSAPAEVPPSSPTTTTTTATATTTAPPPRPVAIWSRPELREDKEVAIALEYEPTAPPDPRCRYVESYI